MAAPSSFVQHGSVSSFLYEPSWRTIIGEAVRHIPREVKERYNDLPWKEMQTMRNIVIHEYHGVNLKIIWQTVTNDLPSIVPQLNKMLKEAEDR